MKKIITIIVLTMCLFLTGCESDSNKFKEEYESLNGKNFYQNYKYKDVTIPEDNPIKYSNYKEIIDIVKNGSGVIYLGYPECPWCRSMVSVLMEAANNTNISTIYYLNMHDVRDEYELLDNNEVKLVREGQEGYQELLETLDEILLDYTIKDSDGVEYSVGEKRIYVPIVIFVHDGTIVDYHIDTVETQTNPMDELTEEEHDELYDIYVSGIHKVLDDLCDENC